VNLFTNPSFANGTTGGSPTSDNTSGNSFAADTTAQDGDAKSGKVIISSAWTTDWYAQVYQT